MNTQAWLARAASWTIVGSLASVAWAKKPAPAPAPPTDQTAPEPAKPAVPTVEEDGPYAPKGKTGKLREEMVEETPSDSAKKPPPPPKKRGVVGLDAVIGFGKTIRAPDVPDRLSTTSFSVVIGGGYEVTKNVVLGLRVPLLATASFRPQQEASFSGTAFGNLELAARYNNELGEHTGIPVELALAIPTGSGDYFAWTAVNRQKNYRAQTAAQASRGLEDDALFSPHRFGFVPGTGLNYDGSSLHVSAFLKIPILVRTGGQDSVPPPAYTLHGVVVETVLGGGGFVDVVSNTLDLGLRAWWTQLWVEPISPDIGEGPSKTQIAIEPATHLKLGQVRGSLGFIWPIGGRVGGDYAMKGVRIGAGYVF
jgi:hypothetical protein